MSSKIDIYAADDGSTTVKIGSYDQINDKVKVSTLTHSFAQGYGSAEFTRSKDFYNFSINGIEYHFTKTKTSASSTTNLSYQYSNECVMAIHLALLKAESKCNPRPIKLYVTLPLEEYFINGSDKNQENIDRKIKVVKTPLEIRDGNGPDGGNIIKRFEIVDVVVLPEGVCPVMLNLGDDVNEFDQTLCIDCGGSTLDISRIFGNFESTDHEGHGEIGVSFILNAIINASKSGRKVNQYTANHILKCINDEKELSILVKNETTRNNIVEAYKKAKTVLEYEVTTRSKNFAPMPDNVCLVGGGAYLIKDATIKAYPDANFFDIKNPQTEQALSMIEYALSLESDLVEDVA
jgi:hypothetical protein